MIITVLEKPSILEFTIEGNVELETEQLEENMREVGLTPGRVFDRSVLEEVTQFLTETYYGRGRYSVKVDTPIEEVGNNQVSVAINIDEGERARIRQINIVGNTSFEDEELLRDFTLSVHHVIVVIGRTFNSAIASYPASGLPQGYVRQLHLCCHYESS